MKKPSTDTYNYGALLRGSPSDVFKSFGRTYWGIMKLYAEQVERGAKFVISGGVKGSLNIMEIKEGYVKLHMENSKTLWGNVGTITGSIAFMATIGVLAYKVLET